MERLVATRTKVLDATLFRSTFDLSALTKILQSDKRSWIYEDEYQGPVNLHPVIQSIVRIPSMRDAERQGLCVVDGGYHAANCPHLELREMDDHATEPPALQVLLDMWNVDWEWPGMHQEYGDLLEADPEAFKHVYCLIEGEDGKPVKVRDVVLAMFSLLDEVRARFDKETLGIMWRWTVWNWLTSAEGSWTRYRDVEEGCVVLQDLWWQSFE